MWRGRVGEERVNECGEGGWVRRGRWGEGSGSGYETRARVSGVT